MHRFFANKDQLKDGKIEILGSDIRHIRDVLRIKNKEKIEIVIDRVVYICKIASMEKNIIVADILLHYEGENEPPIDLILYQGLAKGSKMDLIFQKCTEVGVREFYPLASHRSIVKIKDIRKEEAKVERWQSIIDEAAKQSKRDIVPKVNGIVSFDEMIEMLDKEDNIIVAYEDENIKLISPGIISGNKVHLIIGPEGGFEAYEIEKLKAVGSKIVSLGPRILRTETAGLVASTMLLYQFGDLGVI